MGGRKAIQVHKACSRGGRALRAPALCDWGRCTNQATIERWSDAAQDWLPCCDECAGKAGELVLRHGDELLQQIAAAANKFERTPIACIEVAFVLDSGQEYTFGFAHALDVIANGLTWDERGNWSTARIATVRTI